MSRLINKNSPAFKPQNQISDVAKAKSVTEVQEWLNNLGVSGYGSRLLAVELVDRAISDRIQKTAPSAAEVYLNDAAKIESLVMNAKRIANTLDEAEELDKLLDQLVDQDSQNEGNSI
jgi:hypothetical protein